MMDSCFCCWAWRACAAEEEEEEEGSKKKEIAIALIGLQEAFIYQNKFFKGRSGICLFLSGCYFENKIVSYFNFKLVWTKMLKWLDFYGSPAATAVKILSVFLLQFALCDPPIPPSPHPRPLQQRGPTSKYTNWQNIPFRLICSCF